MRYYKYKKSNSSGKVLAVLLTIAVATLAFFAVVTKGFTVNDPKQWFGKDSEPVEASLTLDTSSVVFKGGTTALPEVKTLNATLVTDEEDAAITWTLEKVGATGSISGVTLTPSEDGASATLVCSSPFNTQLRVKAHVPGTDLLAVSTVDCLGNFDNVYASVSESGEPGDEWGSVTGLCTDGGSYDLHAYARFGTFASTAVTFRYELVLKLSVDYSGDVLSADFEYVFLSGSCSEFSSTSVCSVEYAEDDLMSFCDKLVALGIDSINFIDGPYGLSQVFEQGDFELELRLIQSAGGQSIVYADSSPLYFWAH